jgi:beta-galactosidase
LATALTTTKSLSHQFEFLAEAVKKFKDHPALEIWNVGSEPELTSSMSEMRLYADDASKINDMLCYCDNCKSKFRVWLKEKYKDIDLLNTAWNRNYKSFDQAELPKTRNTFNDIIDWRMFFVYTIGENVKKRFEVAKSIDSGKHPLMCHHVFIQGFPVTSTASDPWNVGQYGDLHGFTQMDDAMMIDILRSCAKDKPVISAEMLMLMGYTLDLPEYIDENDIKRQIFRGIAGNLKGFVFWQYRPEILGREAPTWGLTYPDGSETEWLSSFSKVGKALNDNTKFSVEGEAS